MGLFGGNDQDVTFTLRAKDEASQSVNRVRLSIGDLAKGVLAGNVATDALRRGFNFLSGVVTESIAEFEQQQQVIAQMNATLQSTQYAAGLTARELVDMANAMAEVTLYTDDQIISAQNLLLTFTNITKETFPAATQAVLDMSTALGQDLSSSAIQLGKALNNPIEGVSALQRVGVSFNNAQQATIEKMVKTGHTIEAQTYILAELQREFGNSAKSAYEAASSVTKLQKNIGELKEDIGSGLTPAINNLFGAFGDVTKGMGGTVNVGKVVFKTFAAIGEFAAATATGIHTLAASLVGLESVGVQVAMKLSGVSTVMKLFGKDTDQAFTDFRSSLKEGVTKTSDFYFNLKDRNAAVLKSWGDLNVAAGTVARSGPAAYQATAAEAKKAKDEIKKTQQAIEDTRKSLDDYRKSLRGETTNIAELFVQQEGKVRDLQKQLDEENNKPADERDAKRIMDIEGQLFREGTALNNARTIESQLPGQVAEARRRAGETDFERSVEDVFARVVEKGNDFARQITYQINFGGTVVGDDGVRRIITETIAAINRQATLSGVAGR